MGNTNGGAANSSDTACAAAACAAATPTGCLPLPLVAAEVESMLFGHYGGATQEYIKHAQMLHKNLASAENSSLRKHVLACHVSAKELVGLDFTSTTWNAMHENREGQSAV